MVNHEKQINTQTISLFHLLPSNVSVKLKMSYSRVRSYLEQTRQDLEVNLIMLHDDGS